MSDERGTCRDCAHSVKIGKDKKPMRPGTVYCELHRKSVANNYVCGQYKKR
jgi:hypothetical protein